MLKILLILTIITLLASADRNQEIISGKLVVTDQDYSNLYEIFNSDFRDHENELYSLYPNVDRFEVFKTNVEQWRKHNSDSENKWTQGITRFADYSNEEFSEQYNLNGGLGAP